MRVIKNNFSRKAISSLIATVLLILVTIAIVGIVAQTVTPLVKDSLAASQRCSDLGLTIEEVSGMTCYDTTQNVASLSVSRGNDVLELAGIEFKLITSEGTSKIADVISGQNYAFIDTSLVPRANAQKVFMINATLMNITNVDKAAITAIVNQGKSIKVCSIKGEVKLQRCANVLNFTYQNNTINLSTCAQLGGTCMPSACLNYQNCAASSGTCGTGTCCLGACTNQSGNQTINTTSSISRSLSAQSISVGQTVTVTLNVSIRNGETYYAIDEVIPSGMTVSNAGTGNTTYTGHIRWVVIENAANTLYTYVLSAGTSGSKVFNGTYMVEGMTNEVLISGTNSLTVV